MSPEIPTQPANLLLYPVRLATSALRHVAVRLLESTDDALHGKPFPLAEQRQPVEADIVTREE